MNFHLKGIGCPEYRSLGPGNPVHQTFDQTADQIVVITGY